MRNFTKEDILNCLDKAAANLDFPGFNGINIDMVTAWGGDKVNVT